MNGPASDGHLCSCGAEATGLHRRVLFQESPGLGRPGWLLFFKWMSVTLGDEFGLMPVMVEEFWITWEDTVAEGELKDDSRCGLCCLGRWVAVTTMGTWLLTCLSVLIKKGLKRGVMRGTTAPFIFLQMQKRKRGQQLLYFIFPCIEFPLSF